MSRLAQPDAKQPITLAYSHPPHYQTEFVESSNDDVISHDHPSERESHISVGVREDNSPPFSSSHILKFVKASNGDISSYDHHLNKDEDELYHFLLDESSKIPTYIVSISGKHTEPRTRTVKGKNEDKIEHYTVTITDFEFFINLADYIVVEPPTHVSHGDEEPCYRGQGSRKVQTPTGPRNAKKREIKAFKADKYARINKGVPPWLKFDGSHRYINQPASSVSVRQWAHEYVTSEKWFKEFVYEKRVFGWNQEKLQGAIETVIKGTGYAGSIRIRFDLSANKIRIRSSKFLSRILSLSPWLSKHFPRGRWETTASMFALFQNDPVEPGGLMQGIAAGGASSTAAAMLLETEEELAEPKGFREGEWFKEWEGKIKSCVEEKIRQSEPMRHARYNAVSRLDGYNA